MKRTTTKKCSKRERAEAFSDAANAIMNDFGEGDAMLTAFVIDGLYGEGVRGTYSEVAKLFIKLMRNNDKMHAVIKTALEVYENEIK